MARRNAILIVTDRKQFPPAAFLASRVTALNVRGDTDVVLASDSSSDLHLAASLEPVRLVEFDPRLVPRHAPIRDYFTHATYARLMMPAVLRMDYSRLLYLDSDVYPQDGRIFGLFDLDLYDRPIAAVRDLHIPFTPNPWNGKELQNTLGVARSQFVGARYLNSGVLLIDVDAYVAAGIETVARMVIDSRTPPPLYLDQTILNFALRGSWTELSPSFNMVTAAWNSFIKAVFPPAIVHFSGGLKPWHGSDHGVDHPVYDEIERYLLASPWKQFLEDTREAVGSRRSRGIAEKRQPNWHGRELRGLLDHLRNTPFADVAQGLTAPRFDLLPADS
jgi:lipopolysaccharide biosynthesis glycosyltransferase